MSRTGLVIVASTRAAAGEYEDRSGPIAVEFLRHQGIDTPDPLIVADADIFTPVAHALIQENAPDVLLSSVGTGSRPDGLTEQAVRDQLDKELTAIAVAFWNKCLIQVLTAVLSRCIAGIAGYTFVMTLPGSTGGVKDCCAVLEFILGILLTTMKGK